MSKKAKQKLPFDKKGGVIVIPRRMLDSSAYSELTPEAKQLMLLMQIHWQNVKPVAYSVREAMEKIPCAKGTVQKAFKQLENKGFIEMIDNSLFCTRTQSKARTWRLTWMPFYGRAPTNEWEK